MADPKGKLVVLVGYDPAGDLRALETDADDALKVAFSEAAKGLVGPHGWISSAWQKQPMLDGYSSRYYEQIADTNLAAGTTDIAGVAVATGDVRKLESFSYYVNSATITQLILSIYIATVRTPFYNVTPPAFLTWTPVVFPMWSIAAEYFEVRVTGATAGDKVYVNLFGKNIDIDE